MGKFYGSIGYASNSEGAVDVIVENPIERKCKGDLVKNDFRLSDGMSTNDTVTIGNSISVIADPYALSHFHMIRYVRWRGVCWKVENVKVETPRLILSLGGVYNGETANEP